MSAFLPPPWIGENYENGGIFKKKIVILGESTYTEEDKDTSQYNIWMAQDHIDGYSDVFRTKLARTFLNTEKESLYKISEFWHSVAYLNYITTPLDGPRKAPSEDQWKQHHQPLNELLKELEPKLMIVLGFRMWDRWRYDSPLYLSEGPTIPKAGRKETYYYSINENTKILLYGMRHPSSGFSWRIEHLSFMNAIKLA